MVREAAVSDVPASYQQAQHLRSYCELKARGFDFSRLVIPAFDIPGQCDVRTMSYVINSHLRRHDTYHSWFEYHDADNIVRRTVANPNAINVVPVKFGESTVLELQDHILETPNPLQWDCFRFGVIQRHDHFTFFASIDHLHMDPVLVNVVFFEIVSMYSALAAGGAPIALPETGSYLDYSVRQHEYASALTVQSPEVRAWIDFVEDNGNVLPHFPLPLGDMSEPCSGALHTVTLMNEDQTDRFETACVDAGARFSGGVWACAALAEYELTGSDRFHVVTPTDTRSTPAEMMTTGWYTGLIPITVPVGTGSFAQAARAAQESFDAGVTLASVPVDRVMQLAPWLDAPDQGFLMMSYLDAGAPPLSPVIIAELEAMNAGVFSDGRFSQQLNMWVNRLGRETTLTVAYPNNPIARESVTRYVEAIKSVYMRVADHRDALTRCPA